MFWWNRLIKWILASIKLHPNSVEIVFSYVILFPTLVLGAKLGTCHNLFTSQRTNHDASPFTFSGLHDSKNSNNFLPEAPSTFKLPSKGNLSKLCLLLFCWIWTRWELYSVRWLPLEKCVKKELQRFHCIHIRTWVEIGKNIEILICGHYLICLKMRTIESWPRQPHLHNGYSSLDHINSNLFCFVLI